MKGNSLQPGCQMWMYMLINSKCIYRKRIVKRDCILHTHSALYRILFSCIFFCFKGIQYFIPKCPTVIATDGLSCSKKSLWSLCHVSFLNASFADIQIWSGAWVTIFCQCFKLKTTCTESCKKDVIQKVKLRSSSVQQYMENPQNWSSWRILQVFWKKHSGTRGIVSHRP